MKKLALVVVLIAFVACERGPSEGPSMADHRFTPDRHTIGVGETIRWVNDTEEAHTVTAVQGSIPDGAEYFSSGGAASEEEATDSLSEELMDPGEAFEWKFTVPGTYRYYCIPHRTDGMEGIVVVE